MQKEVYEGKILNMNLNWMEAGRLFGARVCVSSIVSLM